MGTQFSIDQKSLATALDKISAATESKHQLTLYRSIRVTVANGWVKLVATSPSMTASTAFEAGTANSPYPVDFGVSQELLSRIVHALPSGSLNFTVDSTSLHVATPSSDFRLNIISPEIFLPTRNFENLNYAAVDMPFFLYSLGKVSYCKNTSADRPRFRSVYIDHEHFAATDGFRLAVFPNKLGFSPPSPTLLPSETVDRLQRLFSGCGQEGGIFIDGPEVILAQGTTQVVLRTVAETYPQYKTVIPRNRCTKVLLDRRELFNALRRVLIVSEKNRLVDFKLDESGLSLASNAVDVGSAGERVPADVADFKEVGVTLNGDYVLDALRAIDQDKVALELRAFDVSVVITDGEHINVIQPVRRD